MSELDYPLEQIIEVKKRRVEEAEKELKKRKEKLEKETQSLNKAKQARDQVKNHHTEKLQQLRASLDEGTTSDKIEQMKRYLDVVKEKLAEEEKKVEKQQKVVDEAQKAVDEAEQELKRKRQEVDNLYTHKDEWLKEMKQELARKEQIEQDELGSVMYLSRMRKDS